MRCSLNVLNFDCNRLFYFRNPTPCENDIGVIWPEAATNGKHVILRDHPVNITDFPPFYENLLFWYNTYDEYNEYLKSGGEVQNKIVP